MSTNIEINEVEYFDSLLNSSWDDIEDLPSFAVWPTGKYVVNVKKAEVKDHQKKDDGTPTRKINIVAELKAVLEVIEGREPPVLGSLNGLTLIGKFGLEKYKQVFSELGKELNVQPKDLLDKLGTGLDLIIDVKERPRSDGKVDPDTGKPLTNNDWVLAILA